MPSLHGPCITLNTGFAFPAITHLVVAHQSLFPEGDVRGKKVSKRHRRPGYVGNSTSPVPAVGYTENGEDGS